MADRDANIDLLFRNGLRDYEILPPADVWEGIKPVLRKKRQSVLFFRIAASLAALITLGSISLILITELPSEVRNPSLSLNDQSIPSIPLYPAIMSPRLISSDGQAPQVIDGNSGPAPEEDPILFTYSLPQPGLFTSFIADNRGVQEDLILEQVPEGAINNSGSTSLSVSTDEAGLVQRGDKNNIPRERRWTIGATVTPGYYSSINLSSDDAAGDIIRDEDAALSYSGGLSFAYRISRRISFQSGVYYSSVGQRISGVGSYSGFSSFHNSKGSGLFSVLTSSGTIISGNNDIYLRDNITGGRVITAYGADAFDPVKSNLQFLNNTLHQSFNYLEIPFVLKYKLLDRTIDFNISGGISYNRLLGNTAFSYFQGDRIDIGETVGLSNVTFSSSIGMGVEYSFSEKLSLNLEPTLRYYLTPLGGLAGSSIHPYSLGILSGISYRF